LQRLLVVSHVVHFQHAGELYAYGPYSREIDIWADLFPEVIIAAPCRRAKPPGDCLPFCRPNIAIRPQRETGGPGLGAKLHQLMMLPHLVGGLGVAMWNADAIHVRCPGNLGLLGAALAPMFSSYRVAKYAGQWNGYDDEPATVRAQRALLASAWWGGPVTVYGDWPNQPAHVVPFFTSMMTTEQQRHAAAVAGARPERASRSRLRVLFAGSLARRKRVDALLDAIEIGMERGLDVEVAIVGDGPEGEALKRQASRLGIDRVVRFVGALPFDESLRWYEWGDCLVLPSTHSEGWPKVVAEAMSHGMLCLAVDHGQISAMLDGRGVVLPTGSPEEIADGLRRVWLDPGAFAAMRARAAAWATQYSLEGLRQALADLLTERWGLGPQALGTARRQVAAPL
jgi:glycosyltransferase involved in cell wall biosynthesis